MRMGKSRHLGTSESSFVSSSVDVDRDSDGHRVDMRLPVLDILESAAPETSVDGDRDVWKGWINAYAPGYLDQERLGDGLASDYNHDNFKVR